MVCMGKYVLILGVLDPAATLPMRNQSNQGALSIRKAHADTACAIQLFCTLLFVPRATA